jgi:iron complex outermembrane receptor protein
MNFLKTSLSKLFNWSYSGSRYLWFVSSALSLIVTQPAWASELITTKIPLLSERDRLSTSATELIAQDENSNQSAISITGVKLKPTETGLEVLLETATGVILQPVTRNEGNTLVVELADAVLELPEGKPFQAENPVAGITAVTVTQVNGDRIQVRITGAAAIPTAEVQPSPNGIRLGVTSTPDEEELVVTGEQNTGYRVPSATTGSRTDTPIRDLPFSVQVLPQELLQDRQVKSVNEALRTIAGVTPDNPSFSAFEGVTIRGFSGRNIIR